MAFPTTPTNGQLTTLNGITYVYATATNTWTRTATASATLSVVTNNFTGNGSATSFTLGATPASPDLVTVTINGLSQQTSTYTLSNNIITFSSAPAGSAAIEVRSTISTNVGILTGLVYDTFTGNNSTTVYTLSTAPTSKNYTIVTVGGIVQAKNTYSVTGTTLTFTTAPPNSSPIEIVTFGPAVQGGGTASEELPHPFLMMGA